MKAAILLCCMTFLLSGVLSSQTIDNPSFKARTGSITNITRIERTPESTKVYVHAIFRPHWWIKESGDNYLEDAATGKRYSFKSAEGIELGKEVYMPDSGTMDYVLLFEPLPTEVRTIHYISPSDSEGNIYDLSLVPQKKSRPSPMAAIKGNWFKTDGSGTWAYGIYDSICILNNRIYTPESIRKRGKQVETTVRDRQTGQRLTLTFAPQKDGTCKIHSEGSQEAVYSKERTPVTQVAAEDDFQQFFRPDSACLQGYIDGYDPRLGFDTGLIYLSNELTREDYPTVIPIAPDGSFTCQFAINHPIESSVVLGNQWIPLYIEPGKTLTMYIDWEAVLARMRSRDYTFPIRNTAYMGPSASLAYLLKEFNEQNVHSYADLPNLQKTLTPDQYKEHIRPIVAQWQHRADSVCQLYQPSAKAVRLIKNKTHLKTGGLIFEFLMGRSYYAKQDTTNLALKVKADDSYYSFLKEMPLDDATALALADADIFLNRFEFMEIFQKMYADQRIMQADGCLTDESQSFLNRTRRQEAWKDSVVARLYGSPHPLFWQITKVRDLDFQLGIIGMRRIAQEYVDSLKQTFTEPFLALETVRMQEKKHPKAQSSSYRLPEGKATDIFRNIIKNHAGKVLFVDFWATTCGPCRAGIEATANLRKKYKDHPEFQFIYITGQKDSPEKAYKEYVEKHLKGEACYYVSETEFNYLRQLFRFNGIPHYELVEKDGSISNEQVSSHDIGRYLEQRFK